MEKRRRLKQNAACAAVATVIYVSGYLLIPDYGEKALNSTPVNSGKSSGFVNYNIPTTFTR
jgi:hypothetical protein